MSATQKLPHMGIVVAASAAAVFGYFAFSVYVIGWTRDAALHGDIVGTWKSFAVLAFGFWLGSSSGGKSRDAAATEPTEVTVTNAPDNPVPITEEK